MNSRLQKIRWKLHCYKQKKLLIWGLENGLITAYDDELIERLRRVYYGGIPASVILLSDGMTNGYCYDRALLMARALIDSLDDVKLLYASVDSLKLNPDVNKSSSLYADHCIVERITKDGKHLIYDTSVGFVYDKRIYWLIENPKVRYVNDKDAIKKFILEDEERMPEDIDRDKYVSVLVLPMLEKTFGKTTEMYALNGIGLLQREIEYYKNLINYNDVVNEFNYDMKKLGLRK